MWKWIKKNLVELGTVIVSSGAAVLEYAPEIIGVIAEEVPDYTFFGKYGFLLLPIIKKIKGDYQKGKLKPGGLAEKTLDKTPNLFTGEKNSKK